MGVDGKSTTPPVVFRYHDYRAFLKDWLDHLKSQRKLSLRELARRAGVAAGTLPMFLSGKRSLAEETLDKLLPHLELDEASSSYLRNLCRLAESESHDERARTLRRLRRFHGYQSQSRAELEV